MPLKNPSEKTRLIGDTDGYDSSRGSYEPASNILGNSAPSVNNRLDDIAPIHDIETSGSSARLTESTKSSRSRGRPRSKSILSQEAEHYDILIDGGEPGTT